jgi:hypothetical protein
VYLTTTIKQKKMKKTLLIITIAMAAYVNLNATVRRVGFFATYIPGTDYADFTSAYIAATAGDTIYVFPGIVNLSQTISKKLIIIGPGSLLDPAGTPPGNADEQANTGIATVSSLTFVTGSEGSICSGFTNGNFSAEASNITIQRNNNITVYLALHPVTTTGVQIIQNYRVNITNGNVNGSSVTNLNVSNNFIYSFSTAPGNTYAGLISNNVWAYDYTQNAGNADGGYNTMSSTNNGVELGLGAYLFSNNILVSFTDPNASSNYNYFRFQNGGNTVFNYNLALQSGTPINWGAGTGNVITPIANASAIFQAFPLISNAGADARYQLGASSPALTTGAGNTPIGMFAGTAPYKLSMVPAIPSVYKLTSPQGNNPSGNTITINVSTRGNN